MLMLLGGRHDPSAQALQHLPGVKRNRRAVQGLSRRLLRLEDDLHLRAHLAGDADGVLAALAGGVPAHVECPQTASIHCDHHAHQCRDALSGDVPVN